jgi:hypothetical protein
MKTRDVVIGLVVLILLIAGAFIIRDARRAKTLKSPLPTPTFQQVEGKFPSLKVPANANRINLNDVTGSNQMGEAFRTSQDNKFTLTIIGSLPTPKAGYFYQGWIVNGNTFVSTGKLDIAKGGYLSEFSSVKDYSSYKKVVVTLEKVFDSMPETHILEGSF